MVKLKAIHFKVESDDGEQIHLNWMACGINDAFVHREFSTDVSQVTCGGCKRSDKYKIAIAEIFGQSNSLHFKEVLLPIVVPAGSYCFIEDTICDYFHDAACKLNIGDPIKDVGTVKYLKPIECFRLKEI